jgi:hypothetical protein
MRRGAPEDRLLSTLEQYLSEKFPGMPFSDKQKKKIIARAKNEEKIVPQSSKVLPPTKDPYPVLLQRLLDTAKQYYPALVPAFRVAAVVVSMMALRNRRKCFPLFFITESGFGKTAVLKAFIPYGQEQKDYLYRSDKFSAQSFVSHAANRKAADLSKVDLLPRLSDKTLVTRELAPLFRGRDEQLVETFSILIGVLDGDGYTSDSGTHGARGYENSILFNWLGATTPLTRRVFQIMLQLGTRLYFFEMPSNLPGEEELLAYAQDDKQNRAGDEQMQILANQFVMRFFDEHPVDSVDAEYIVIPEPHLKSIVRLANLMVNARRPFIEEDTPQADGTVEKDQTPGKPEGPFKHIDAFKELARASALIDNRTEVNDEDIRLVAHIALSSLPRATGAALQQLRAAGRVTSSQCAERAGVSQPTARKTLDALHSIGVVYITPG